VAAGGRMDDAADAIHPDSRNLYRQIFEMFGADIAGVLSEFSDVEPMRVTQDFAQYLVMNMHNGTARVFVITLVRDPDGVWRIESM
jgi:hypothetical protein